MTRRTKLLTTGQVARALGWSVDTIRRHLVPVTEWTSACDGIPFYRVGAAAQYRIPAWWLDDTLAALRAPNPQEG